MMVWSKVVFLFPSCTTPNTASVASFVWGKVGPRYNAIGLTACEGFESQVNLDMRC